MHSGDPRPAHAAENQQFCTSALLSEKSRGSCPLFPACLWSVYLPARNWVCCEFIIVVIFPYLIPVETFWGLYQQ